jgi:hypothetical protein
MLWRRLMVLLAVSSTALASPSLSPQTALDEGRLAYERGEYTIAVSTIHPLLYPSIELATEDAVVEAHRLLALSYFFMKKENEAEQEVSSLLALRPGYELDPIVDPPVAVRFFQGVRTRQEQRLKEVQKRQKDEDHAKAERVFIERTVKTSSRAVAMLPFGIGQFQNGDIGLGAFFASSEVVFGAVSLAMWIAILEKFPTHQFAVGDQQSATALTGVQLATGAAFYALAVSGIIEGQVRLVPMRETTRELPPQPKVSITPLLAPGFFGLGAHGAF